MPEGPSREEALVDHGRIAVAHLRSRHVPALPARLRRPVAEVDVLPVEPEALVEPAEVLEHFAPEEEERAKHPVCLHRLARPLVEEVVTPLALARAKQEPKRRAANERPRK